MKKIIDGRKYDTSTATELATACHGTPRDFAYFEETLFRKRSGEYFIYGFGHAASRYAQARPDGDFGAGEAIRPVTYDQAVRWAEESLDADEYEELFGEVPEDDGGTVAVTLRISAAARDRLRRESERSGRTQSQIVEAAILAL